mgnify:CR=1 FL=1
MRYVGSEPLFLEGTLLANLMAFASYERMTRATDAGECGNAVTMAENEAWAALDSLGMRGKIEALPLRLQTPTGRADLSAGERQLLSLARALVAGRGPRALRLLMCDEPTSCLDLASDHLVHNVLTSLSATVMITEHRLAHVDRFDRVIVLDRGRLVEQGTAQELLDRPGSVLAQLKAQQQQAGSQAGAAGGSWPAVAGAGA